MVLLLALTACGLLGAPARPAGPPDALRCPEVGGPHDCFVHVPAGTLRRGAQALDPAAPGYDPAARPDEGPVAEVAVPGFWVLRHELSRTAYARCVGEGRCAPVAGVDDAGRAGFPVTDVSWSEAAAACAWLGGALPSELQWERAARGDDGRRFPWGDAPRCPVHGHEPASCPKEPVATAALTAPSPFGVYGLAGNVWEWVADAYVADAYASGAPAADASVRRVQRGGGFSSEDLAEWRSAARASLPPDSRLHDVGFRCVWPAP
jgi:formylglycine-generating enzyme required for sulfatase activity